MIFKLIYFIPIVGDFDGTFEGVKYYDCQPNHGVLIPLFDRAIEVLDPNLLIDVNTEIRAVDDDTTGYVDVQKVPIQKGME